MSFIDDLVSGKNMSIFHYRVRLRIPLVCILFVYSFWLFAFHVTLSGARAFRRLEQTAR
jgi:hypothetical protein